MGAGQSAGVEIGGSPMGYQVLRVYPNSPGSKAGLKAYFDFIVAIGTTRFVKEDGSLREILKASIDQKLKMVVYSTRTKTAREVEIVPSTSWGGSGLLGVSIKHSSFDRADERVWHVVEVDPGSPAHQAGFKADEDYVIGSDSILQENDDLYNLIEAHEGKALKLFVYNSKTDNCREVICHPNSRWGGRGYLGCEFGHGLLHRIPYTSAQDKTGYLIPTTNSGDLEMRSSIKQHVHTIPLTNDVTSSNMSPLNQYGPPNQQLPPHQVPPQPGNQLFQQALLGFQQTPDKGNNDRIVSSLKSVGPQTPLPTPQTFAQLANSQFNTDISQDKQQMQQPYQQPQPQNQEHLNQQQQQCQMHQQTNQYQNQAHHQHFQNQLQQEYHQPSQQQQQQYQQQQLQQLQQQQQQQHEYQQSLQQQNQYQQQQYQQQLQPQTHPDQF